jgi:neutral ceramidase
MSGFAIRTAMSEGVHDRLYARAMAMAGPDGEPVVMVTIDVIGVDAAITRRVRRALWRRHGVTAERVAVVATHTHGGPALLEECHLGRVEPEVREGVVSGAIGACSAALETLEPARLRWGRMGVPGLARNRRNERGPVDPTLHVLWVSRGGTVRAILCTFALHPVVLGPDNLLLTRDFPGYLVDALETSYPEAVVLFANGCAGQVNHGHRAEASLVFAPSPNRTFDAAARVGSRLAEATESVIAAGGSPARMRGACTATRRRVLLPFGAVEAVPGRDAAALAGAWRSELEDPGTPPERIAMLAELVAWAGRWMPSGESSSKIGRWSEVQSFQIGDQTIVFLPGEPFVEIGLALDSLADPHVLTIGYANDAAGYVPTDDAIDQGGYEVDAAYRFYGLPWPYAKGAAERLEHAASAAVRRARRRAPAAAALRSKKRP